MLFFCCYHNYVAEPPQISSQPALRDAIPGKPVTVTIQATGTEFLSYDWQHDADETESGWWHSCDGELFLGANSSKLTIPSAQKSNEGSYRCIISNIVGSQTSEPIKLNIGKTHV